MTFISEQQPNLCTPQFIRQSSQLLIRNDHDCFQREHLHQNLLSIDRWREVSDEPGVTTPFPLVEHHWRIWRKRASPVTFPSTARGITAPSPNHLTTISQITPSVSSMTIDCEGERDVPNSFAQFLTSEEGQTTIALSIACFPGKGDCRSRVHINAIHWSYTQGGSESAKETREKRREEKRTVFPNPISSAMIHLKAGCSTSQSMKWERLDK